MLASKVIHRPGILVLGLAALFLAGCMEPETPPAEKTPQPVAQDPENAIKASPTVTLVEAKAVKSPGSSSVRVHISATGPFGFNVIKKSDPERIIVIVHNAQIGNIPQIIEVNDGAISRLETAQLNTGRNQAARITIGLTGKADYQVVTDENAIMVDIKE